MNLANLKKLRASAAEAAQAIFAKAETENRALTAEELSAFTAKENEVKALDEQIAAGERALALGNRATGAVPPAPHTPATVHNRAEDAPFRDIGDFCASVVNSELRRETDPRLVQLRAAQGMSETVASDGGFLVQSDIATEIRERMFSAGRVMARCNRTPISANSNGLKLPAVDETSRADGSQFGGITCYWAAEAGTATASKPKFGVIDLELKKVLAATYLTSELMQDTTALSSWLQARVPVALRWKVENSIFRGKGAGTPLGILEAPCTVSVAKETGQSADTIVAENVIKMYARFAGDPALAAWYINRDCLPQLMKLSIAVGTGGIPIWLPAGSIAGVPYNTMFGIPVEPVDYCSTVGDTGDVVLADFSQYELIDKGGIQNAVSIHVQFLTDEQVLRWTYRVDGKPGWTSKLTPAQGTNTVSPFVKLDAR